MVDGARDRCKRARVFVVVFGFALELARANTGVSPLRAAVEMTVVAAGFVARGFGGGRAWAAGLAG